MPKKHCHTVPDEHKHRLELVNECLHNDLARLGEEQDRYRKVEALVNRRHQERLQRLLTEVFGVPAVPEGSLLTHNVEEHTVTVMLPEQAGEGANRPKDLPASAHEEPSMARVYLMSGRKQWHHDIPDGWEEYAHERFDYVECGIYEKPTRLLTDEDKEWAEGRTEPPDEWVEPSRREDVVHTTHLTVPPKPGPDIPVPSASAPTDANPGWITPPAGVATGGA